MQSSRSSRTPARLTPSISRRAASRRECASSRPVRLSRRASRVPPTPPEARLSPLRQRSSAFAKILGYEKRALREHLEFLERHLVEAVALVDNPLREPDRERGVARHLARQLLGRRQMRT